jgi:dihydrofolate reductase
VRALAAERDVAVIGSTNVVHQLAAAGAVDEYRLLVMPTALGRGARLFSTTAELRLESVTAVDPAVLLRYRIV